MPRVGGVEQERVEHRDERLRALEAEALLPEVLRVQEALERLGRVQALEDAALLLGSSGGSACAPSTCSWIHSFWSGSWMCMYSTPMVRA